MRRLSVIIYTILCLALYSEGKTHHRMFTYDHIGIDDGLASQRVYSMVEDQYGGMWVGIKNGVARYNGRTLHNYTLGDADKKGDTGGIIIKVTKISNSVIIAYDNKGRIFKYVEAFDRFIPIANAFTKTFSDINKNGGGLILKDIVADAANNLWASTSKGLFFVSFDGKTVKRYFSEMYANTVVLYGKYLIACTTTGTYLIDSKTRKILRYLLDKNTETAFVDSKRNRLWLGTFNSGAFILDMKWWKTISTDMQTQLPHIPVRAIKILNDTTMLVGIDGSGVYTVDMNGRDPQLLWSNDDENNNVLHGNGVYDILHDSHDNVWVGSYTGGIDIAYPTGGVVTTYEHKQGIDQSLINNGVNDVIESDGIIYFATDRGVSMLNTNTKQWAHTLYGKVVLTMCKANNCILAGTYGDGVFGIAPDGTYSQLYCTGNGTLATNYVFSVIRDRRGSIWIGCLDGPTVEISSDRTYQYDIQTVQCIAETPDGKIAIGTASGFHIIDPVTHKSTHYLDFDECRCRDINNYIKSILFNNDGTVWLATDGGGIYRYNTNSRKYHIITYENGLPSNNISAICFDKKGRIIASTDAGLAIVYPKTMDAININFINGVNREYNRMSMGKVDYGRIIFGSNNGAVCINPALIDKLSYSAKLRISSISINGEEKVDDSRLRSLHQALMEGCIKLTHSENSFTIAFESICYRYRNDIAFQYMLKGFDDVWSESSDNSTAQFTNLPAGKYILKVRASSHNDKRILDEQNIEIVIAEPWWNSAWAWLIYCSILGFMGYLAMKNYHGKLERKYFNEKIDFFVHAAHDIRTPLSLVLAPLSEIAKDKGISDKSRESLSIAKNNGDKLLGMIGELLDFQKADVVNNPIHLTDVNVRIVMEGVVNRFRMMAKDKNIQLEITDCPDNIFVSMDNKLGAKIFDNLLSNAIKYTTEGGKIELRGYIANGSVKIDVKDNGIGIPEKEQKNIFKNFYRARNVVKTNIQGSGLGLMLARRITELHNGKLTFESEEGKGTTFTVTLPLVKDNNLSKAAVSAAIDETANSDIILFVDDNEDLRSYIKLTFSDKYKVITVENGEKALEYLNDNECDLVVSDVMMPGIQGDELCRRIKERHDTSWMPVILLTAKAGKDFIIEGLKTGADDYITKPFDTEILESKIETTLANRRRMSEYYRKRVDKIANDGHTMEEQETNDDNRFIDKATNIVISRMADTDFDIDQLCREMAMSRTLFYGKIKTLTAQTPQDFIRNIRLQRAASLLNDGKKILDVCAICGFANSKHFSTVFKKRFGVSPSKYIT